ncbi:hypothetical protein GTA08_BOTSDO02910 [Neofusicoccum parvum]|nr:hypothetical protein GTA08_BOTSDO02910 [Neofusicoccum parvum]
MFTEVCDELDRMTALARLQQPLAIKCHTQGFELDVQVQGDAICEEYSPYFDKDGSLCCWIPVTAGEELSIHTTINGKLKVAHLDLILDGVLRHSRAIHSNGKRSLRHENFVGAYLKREGSLTFCKMKVENLGETPSVGAPKPELVGTIEVRLAIADGTNENGNETHEIAHDTFEETDDWREAEDVGVFSRIPPTHEISLAERSIFQSQQMRKFLSKHLKADHGRPGSKPRAVMKFFYRSKDAILAEDLERVPNSGYSHDLSTQFDSSDSKSTDHSDSIRHSNSDSNSSSGSGTGSGTGSSDGSGSGSGSSEVNSCNVSTGSTASNHHQLTMDNPQYQGATGSGSLGELVTKSSGWTALAQRPISRRPPYSNNTASKASRAASMTQANSTTVVTQMSKHETPPVGLFTKQPRVVVRPLNKRPRSPAPEGESSQQDLGTKKFRRERSEISTKMRDKLEENADLRDKLQTDLARLQERAKNTRDELVREHAEQQEGNRKPSAEPLDPQQLTETLAEHAAAVVKAAKTRRRLDAAVKRAKESKRMAERFKVQVARDLKECEDLVTENGRVIGHRKAEARVTAFLEALKRIHADHDNSVRGIVAAIESDVEMLRQLLEIGDKVVRNLGVRIEEAYMEGEVDEDIEYFGNY